ncbi:hypothetical protein [Ciceribacter sp. L1K22]|uniref:SH3 domain-containing protein n=1 Tax=Ciceribacter sp. L1K22 TaxID=2820275 RepID=UPI001ABE1684|nr:hypothetical protein [Ciceribacter sp. L1K22]MBO3758429.1 hypothetical protein [Ciceribacter sp. L1K22]
MKSLSYVVAGVALLLSVEAGAAEDIWSMTTPEGTCRISFQDDPVADGIQSILQHDYACPEMLRNVSGYSMNNGDGTIILYTTFTGLEMVGRADKEKDGLYVGMIGDGTELTISFGETPDLPTKPQKPQKPKKPSGSSACLRYPDGGCAQPNDVGSPDVALGINSIQALTRLNIRGLPGMDGAVIGRLEKDQCVTVLGCVEKGGNVIWCEVDLPTFHGWTLKQDAGKVYSRNGCG